MAGSVDFVGIATLISSVTASSVAIVSLVRGRDRDKKLDVIAHGVDGLSDKRAAAAHAKGVRDGADDERANPTEPR